ncbi:hypothetical protein DL767_006633 [Monosporascus sp. MG133]|nr:hypothetical protein DL767_006633 [Monosporascus sp. MG133]
MSKSARPFPKLQDTLADGRLATVFFRRDQLRRLQGSLLQHKDGLLDGIVKDSGNNLSEAFAELYMTLSAVKLYHDELNPKEQLAAEYRIAKGRDAADAREGIGIVVLVPQNHTFVYSVLAPLAAAIAAGNCVVVVLEQTLLSLPSIVSDILRESLDRDVYETVQARPKDVEANCIQVIQTGDADAEAARMLLSPSKSLVIAIVDRTADLEEAARTLVDARMKFGGRSTYAPDVILVNEFAKQDFLNAAVRHSIIYMTEENGSLSDKQNRLSGGEPKIGNGRTDQSSIRTITSGANSSILDIVDSSLDDAVEVANDLSGETLLAVYAFGDLPSCKYLLQFTSAYAGFANLIPTELLVGPAAAKDHPLTLSPRYPSSLFSAPRPRFTEKTALSLELSKILDSRRTEPAVEAELLKKVGVEDRAPVRLITGYFEGAFLVGLATKMAPLVVGLGALAYLGIKKAVVRLSNFTYWKMPCLYSSSTKTHVSSDSLQCRGHAPHPDASNPPPGEVVNNLKRQDLTRDHTKRCEPGSRHKLSTSGTLNIVVAATVAILTYGHPSCNMPLTPVHFFSHGSTMMLGEESESADYWKKCGDEALAHGLKGVVIMGAHWATHTDAIEVATNPMPKKSPVAYVHPSKYKDYELNPDLATAERCVSLLRDVGFNANPNPSFNWIHDTYLILIRMFPNGCPPTTIVSMNPRYDPHYHMRVGLALRPLRAEGYLLIGSGGAVHNLYRNVWDPMILYGDNFAQPTPPGPWALEFRQSVEDVMRRGGGPRLRRAVTRLMKHPLFRDAHATDDHFMSMCFAAGAAGTVEDEGAPGEFGAEDWELTNMCNSQYTIGTWKGYAVKAAA